MSAKKGFTQPLHARVGFILIDIVYLSAVFIIVIIPLIGWSVNEYAWTTHSFKALRALNLADAGADLAVWEIVHNNAQFTGWSGINPKTLTLASFKDDFSETIGDIAVTGDNTSPGHYLITSKGFVPDMANPTAKKTVKVKVFPHALFNNGLFGTSSVSISGNSVIDSYDSSIGPYSPITARANADVGTNGILSISDNAVVKGDALIGPNGSASGVTQANVTGEIFYSGEEVELAEVELPDYLAALSSLGDLTIGGQNEVTLPSGNYRYENISVTGQSALTISANTNLYVSTSFTVAGQAMVITQGAVEIYLGGDGSFAGKGIVNETGLPNNLEIYGLGDDTSLSFGGLNDFYGTIYAPDSTIYMGGNATYFGAVAGSSITLGGNNAFHYDEALSQNGPFSGYDIAYWQED